MTFSERFKNKSATRNQKLRSSCFKVFC